MVTTLADIDALILTHHNESSEGIVDVAPSKLTRGQGTEKSYYILKIDLVGSTMLLRSSRKATYLRLAHTFLSTVDRITQDYGADPTQTEYAGDSVIAYFPEGALAENVLRAAVISKIAVERLARLEGAVGALKPLCKIVLHFAPLIIAKIGPRAGSFISAIGYPIHRVAKIEKEINSGVGRVTEEFYKCINRENRSFFTRVFTEQQVLVTQNATPNLWGLDSHNSTIAELLYPNTSPAPQPQYRTQQTTIGYDIKWSELNQALGLVQRLR